MSQNNKREPSGDGDGDGDGGGGGEAKRLKSALTALNDIAEEYVCPITLELPLRPVTAQDGFTYEESAIREHIERARAGNHNLKSPVTNARMGPELVTAAPVRNTIEKLVRSGALDGDKARNWERRIADEKLVVSLRAKAENGDVKSMFKLGSIFCKGILGENLDVAKAVRFYQRAADLKYPPGMANVGEMLVLGLGTTQNVSGGMILVTSAAERGSSYAAYKLGLWYATGSHGVPKDADRAKEWLQKAITSDSGEFAWDISEDTKNYARNLLNKQIVGESK